MLNFKSFCYFQQFEEIFYENQKPDFSDHSGVHKAFEFYEVILTKNKYLTGDHVTLAGQQIMSV